METVIIVILVILLLLCIIRPFDNNEGFCGYTSVSLPVGSPLYGLRGDRLRTSDIAKNYLSPYRQIRLNHAGGEMYISDRTPEEEGYNGCRKVKCPINQPFGEYDCMDTCWKCSDGCPDKMCIPSLQSHA